MKMLCTALHCDQCTCTHESAVCCLPLRPMDMQTCSSTRNTDPMNYYQTLPFPLVPLFTTTPKPPQLLALLFLPCSRTRPVPLLPHSLPSPQQPRPLPQLPTFPISSTKAVPIPPSFHPLSLTKAVPIPKPSPSQSRTPPKAPLHLLFTASPSWTLPLTTHPHTPSHPPSQNQYFTSNCSPPPSRFRHFTSVCPPSSGHTGFGGRPVYAPSRPPKISRSAEQSRASVCTSIRHSRSACVLRAALSACLRSASVSACVTNQTFVATNDLPLPFNNLKGFAT